MAVSIASVAMPSLRRSSVTHQPASYLVGCDSLDAMTGKAQLGAAEEALVPSVPDRPGAEAVLSPLQLGGASVAQCVGGVLRRSCVLGLVKSSQRDQDQTRCSENDSTACRPRRFARVASMHARSMARCVLVIFPNSLARIRALPPA